MNAVEPFFFSGPSREKFCAEVLVMQILCERALRRGHGLKMQMARESSGLGTANCWERDAPSIKRE
jgi:hypothetical protein